MTSAASPSPSLQFSTLIGSTIEAILHELLYLRSIYPPDSFYLYRHLGVRCHASRVPQVGDYIADFLRVAIPSIVAGVGDGLSLIILEEETLNRSGGGNDRSDVGERTGSIKTVERVVFHFQIDAVIGAIDGGKIDPKRMNEGVEVDDFQKKAIKRDLELAVEARAQLERSMRECLLRVLALRKRRRRKEEKAENMSFKLCLHLVEDEKPKEIPETKRAVGKSRSRNSCPELMKALQRGEWLQPDESSCLFSSPSNGSAQQNSKGLLRPIKDVILPSCGMKMQMALEVDPF